MNTATVERTPAAGPEPVARDHVLLVWTVLAVFALAAGGWFGWSWWSAAHDPTLNYSATRDSVLGVGRQDLVALNTLDYQHPDEGLDGWLAIATGPLHDELSKDKASNVKSVRAAKTASTAKVVDSALTSLDTGAGKASMTAVMEVTLTVDGGKPTVRRNRLTADLARTSEGWRISGLGALTAGGAQ